MDGIVHEDENDAKERRIGVAGLLNKWSFRKIVAVLLMVMMGVVMVFATVDLGFSIVKEILAPPTGIITVERLPTLLELFLWILICMELLDSVRMYFREQAVHVENVLTVGMIALANKVIVTDIKEITGTVLLGIAAILAALGVSYFLVRRSHGKPDIYDLRKAKDTD